jgi:hypothetical protein
MLLHCHVYVMLPSDEITTYKINLDMLHWGHLVAYLFQELY